MKIMPTQPIKMHNYAIIDRSAMIPERLRWDLPLLKIITPVLKSQVTFYPCLLSIEHVEPDIWQEIVDEVNSDIAEGREPLFSMLLSSQLPPKMLQVRLADCLLINGQGVNHIVRYYVPEILFHLAWAYSADEERYFRVETEVDYWTLLLDGQWHTLVFSEETQDKAPLGRLGVAEIKRLGAINRIFDNCPDIKQKRLDERITLSKQSYAALKRAEEIYKLPSVEEQSLFAYHCTTVDVDIESHPRMVALLAQCRRGASYEQQTGMLTKADWQKMADDLHVKRKREQEQQLMINKERGGF